MAMRCRWCLLAGTLVFLLLLPSSASGSDEDSVARDRAALLAFKEFITADPAGLVALWNPSDRDHCAWPGVACDERGRVVELSMSARATSSPSKPTLRRCCADPSRRLAGTLNSAALSSLSALRVLSLPFHAFSGPFPAEIWSIPYLSVLDLASNQLHGKIAAVSGTLKFLEIIDLSGNQLNGTVPSFLLSLPNLKSLSLSFNQLSGTIPDMPSDGNGTGCLNLQHLDLAANLLVGSIPRSLGICHELQTLLLFSNLLDDAIPLELGQLKKLQALDVSRNSLSGPVPSELSGCSKLSVLILSNPYFPVIDSNTENYGNIDDFNYYEGGIPQSVLALPKLRVLWAQRATLEGEIPENWSNCTSLEMVNLGENLLSGQMPKGLVQCRNLKFLNLSSNKLTGQVDEELVVPCMNIFDIYGNQLSGSIPQFKLKSCPAPQLPVDGISSAYMSFFMFNTLAAVFPSYVAYSMNSIWCHDFGKNNFTGNLHALPIARGKRVGKTAYAFYANGNSLSGQVAPTFFGKCRDFDGVIIDLSNNQMSGEIPKEIGSLCAPLMVFKVTGNQLTGFIPPSVGQLENIVTFDLSHNQLRGAIPVAIGNLLHTTNLLLGANLLTGNIPTSLSQLSSLMVLDLSSNSLSGEIPAGLVNLQNLTVLLLDNNKFSGKIPLGFSSATSLVVFNVSFNNLSGPLPSNIKAIKCDAVLGNPLLPCISSISVSSSGQQGRGLNSQDYNGSTPGDNSTQGSNSGFSSIEIASIASATAIVAVLLALVILFIYTRKCGRKFPVQPRRRKEVITFSDMCVTITFDCVVRATGNFNASNCIGSGGFGATYKAEISPGVLVAIKRLSVGRIQGLPQFHAEIKTLGKLRHPNLVTLIGYHLSDSEMFLIYNYLSGGNLEKFINERSKRPVDWRMLHKIALDIARALAYLHETCVPRILHRDVKPSNILLDNEYNAFLSDFGLARLLGNSETHATTGVAGTFGYVAPEYAMTCRVSDKADVYSYGVVLMELISDKKALDPSFSPYGNGFNIVAWAHMLIRQGRAREFFMEGLWNVGPHDDLVEILHLAVMCTVETLSIRPTMKEVVQRLKQLQPPIRQLQ